MCETGRVIDKSHRNGKRLTKFEVQALGERWYELFGCSPPSHGNGQAVQPAPIEPELQDTTMLHMIDVVRMTGLSTSTIKRKMGKTFPAPTKISVRRIGWPAHKVKAWLAEREAGLES